MYHKWQSYDVWFQRYWAEQTEFFVILGHFLPFYPTNNLQNQNFEKNEKTPGDIIVLHKCTINDNHMMYDSWDMECDRQNFLSLWTVFCLFIPLTTQKSKFGKNEKKPGDIIILQMCATNDNHDVWFQIYGATNRFFCYFRSFFTLLPTPLTICKIKILKKWKKKHQEILFFYTCVP